MFSLYHDFIFTDTLKCIKKRITLICISGSTFTRGDYSLLFMASDDNGNTAMCHSKLYVRCKFVLIHHSWKSSWCKLKQILNYLGNKCTYHYNLYNKSWFFHKWCYFKYFFKYCTNYIIVISPLDCKVHFILNNSCLVVLFVKLTILICNYFR